jgi:hypothetical protein
MFSILKTFLSFSLMQVSRNDDHPEDSLPKFGYNPDMKVKKSSSLLHIFGLHGRNPVEKIWRIVQKNIVGIWRLDFICLSPCLASGRR